MNLDNFNKLDEHKENDYSPYGQKNNQVIFYRIGCQSQLETDYTFRRSIGKGNYGSVYEGYRNSDNSKCAIKKIIRDKKFSAVERSRIDQEISILRFTKHPNIIELYAVAESPYLLFLITELCEGDSLQTCIYKLPENCVLEEYIVVSIVKQTASALSYLHNRSIVHRDLKPCNIMLAKKIDLEYRKVTQNRHLMKKVIFSNSSTLSKIKFNNSKNGINGQTSAQSNPENSKHFSKTEPISFQIDTKSSMSCGVSSSDVSYKFYDKSNVIKTAPPELQIKLIDFGLSIELKNNEEVLDDACGTPLFMAPEVLNGRSYTRQCDVWSLGVLMYLLLTNQLLFNSQSEEQLLNEINNFDINQFLDTIDYISIKCIKCLRRLLTYDPAYRYSAAELLLDPWINVSNEVYGNLKFNSNKLEISNGRLSSTSDNNIVQSEISEHKKMESTESSMLKTETYYPTNVLELMKEYHKQFIIEKP